LLDQACAHCPIFPTAASRRSLGRVSVPVWLIILSDQLTIVALVGLYPANKLIVRRLLSRRLAPLALGHHAVLAIVSHGCPPPGDRYLRVTHPSATAGYPAVRLACVKHAASVRSEPGSNSQVHHVRPNRGQTRRTNPASYQQAFHPGSSLTRNFDLTSVTVTLSEYVTVTPNEHHAYRNRAHDQNPIIDRARCPTCPPHSHAKNIHASSMEAPPTYPFHSVCNCQRTEDKQTLIARHARCFQRRLPW
jgi:hypothetical protein